MDMTRGIRPATKVVKPQNKIRPIELGRWQYVRVTLPVDVPFFLYALGGVK